MTDNPKNTTIRLIQSGTEIAGAAVGGALGFIAGGPLTAAGASATGVVIAKLSEHVITDFSTRVLSHREEVRVGAAAAVALAEIKDRIERGESVRTDGFCDTSDAERSAADEVFEGVLIAAKNEHQEKKIRILGAFFSQVLFAPGVSLAEANHIISVAERLTFRQMCILALLVRKTKGHSYTLRQTAYRGSQESIRFETLSTLQELFELYNMGFVACKMPSSDAYDALLGWYDAPPAHMELTSLGQRFAVLMTLDSIPSEDVESTAQAISE